MRKPSKLSERKRQDRIEAARRMTGEQRLEVCVRLSWMVEEFRRAGEADRASTPKPTGAGS